MLGQPVETLRLAEPRAVPRSVRGHRPPVLRIARRSPDGPLASNSRVAANCDERAPYNPASIGRLVQGLAIGPARRRARRREARLPPPCRVRRRPAPDRDDRGASGAAHPADVHRRRTPGARLFARPRVEVEVSYSDARPPNSVRRCADRPGVRRQGVLTRLQVVRAEQNVMLDEVAATPKRPGSGMV